MLKVALSEVCELVGWQFVFLKVLVVLDELYFHSECLRMGGFLTVSITQLPTSCGVKQQVDSLFSRCVCSCICVSVVCVFVCTYGCVCV